ncbi:hypothetical protein CONLIGDRAFT_160118 [Coniochaeta ligniaria NRRL 30616]|uniref:Uncharacterized protein n=1 Tax=Coniochaeta ligniaria NRRL 30616 TaxID=1408157 RepID=A0A1J7IZQ9_9PEZI|nr:hypothetical protein CONLIGDRAFT_160118 [Coniochaeta ligniaria NRRL 30616]
MPPIPIYTKSPINAAKADGATPQTAAAPEKAEPQPATTTATSTQEQGGYPAAQPGAVPSLPAVTAAPPSQQYVPLQPTPTSSLGYQGPPPPQPGAMPVAPRATAQAAASGPPPATVTEPPRLPGQGPPVTATYPHQMSIPAPTVPQAQRGTSTAFVVPFSAAQADMGHPPGYQQNVNADQFTSSQREGQYTATHSSYQQASDESEEGVWNAARKWAQAAGDKLSAAENEVWRRINGKE